MNVVSTPPGRVPDTQAGQSRLWHWCRITLGLLLLTAAILKLLGSHVAPVPRTGWLADPRIESIVLVWELGLAAWLLSGVVRTGGWLAAVGTFLTFAAASGYAVWVGVADCGCFGAIKTSPWVALAVDLTCLALLAAGRPQWTSGTGAELRSLATAGLKASGGVAVLLGVTAAIAVWAYGSPERALAHLRGELLSAGDGYLDFGSGRPGDRLDASVAVRNWTDSPVRLIGGTSDCSCTTTEDLPVTVPPGGSMPVHIHLKVPPSNSGQLTRTVTLRTDCPGMSVVRLRVGCRVK
jgi:hypothetical protein